VGKPRAEHGERHGREDAAAPPPGDHASGCPAGPGDVAGAQVASSEGLPRDRDRVEREGERGDDGQCDLVRGHRGGRHAGGHERGEQQSGAQGEGADDERHAAARGGDDLAYVWSQGASLAHRRSYDDQS
jgi:hypothetical protein